MGKASMTDKLIVTNKAALRAKYGAAGLRKVMGAVSTLIAADRRRGLVARLIDLSSAAAMRRLNAPPVTDALHPKQNKDAIDALFRTLQPDYLMLLGSIDVIAHQDLANPVYAQDKEDDPKAWSDLPYACDAPYSRDIADFIGPTRVVARLPDLTGARDPAHLLRLLATATRYRTRPLKDYAPYFSLSVRLWQSSTARSLENIFGNDDALAISPPSSAARSRALGRLSHFINCHGGLADPQFYGEYRGRFPVAMATRHTRGKIREGTVAAVECCYGGELYDSVTLALDEPICQSYLAQGAYGYLGSTTIAYGPAQRQRRGRPHHAVLPAGGSRRRLDRPCSAQGAAGLRRPDDRDGPDRPEDARAVLHLWRPERAPGATRVADRCSAQHRRP
jgi:hypothetical protein